MSPNACFLPPTADPLLTDLAEGLRYMVDSVEYRLPWPVTYDDLARLPVVEATKHHAFGWPVFRVNAPVRFGLLEVTGLEINQPMQEQVGQPTGQRFDVPVDNYPFEIRLAERDRTQPGADNYWQLKNYLLPTLGDPNTVWERDDQLHSTWDANGLQLSITYWFKSRYSAESGYASLSITNARIYPAYLSDDYVNNLSISWLDKFKTFDISHLGTGYNYRTSVFVRQTPAAIREELIRKNHPLAVWLDEPAGRLGFADRERAQVLPWPLTGQLSLDLFDLDRGVYHDGLVLTQPDGLRIDLAEAAVGKLNKVVKTLKTWGLAVERYA